MKHNALPSHIFLRKQMQFRTGNIMHYILFLSVSFKLTSQAPAGNNAAFACATTRLQKQRSTKHTNSRQRTSSHGRRRRSRTFRSTCASAACRARIDGSSSDADAIARRSLHASARTGRHGSGDDRRSGCRSLATRPRCPRRIRSSPGTLRPTAPGRSRASRTAPPACPGAFGPGT